MNQVLVRLDKEMGEKVASHMKDMGWKGQMFGLKAIEAYFESLDKPKVKPKTTKPAAKRFVKPTWEELASYFHEQGSLTCQDDATRFIDYYDSNGWKVGKNSMKDWKATVRQWTKRRKENEQGNGKRSNQGVEAGHAAISSSEF